MDVESSPRELRAGSLRLDLAARRAFASGRELELEPLVHDLLAVLLEHPGEVVSKDALWRRVWQARPVSDSVIPHAVSKLRRALDAAGAPEQVLAVHGRGYRLAVSMPSPQEPQGAAAMPGPAPGPRTAPGAGRSLLRTALVLLGVAVAAVAVALLAGLPEAPQARPERIALLPIENATGDPALDWTQVGLLPILSQGLSDAGVDVVSSSDVLGTLRRYPDATGTQRARQLARSSGADRVLALRLVRHEGGLRLSMRDALGQGFEALALDGAEPTRLAVAAAGSAAQQVRRLARTPEFRPALSGDPFADEAYARGLDARLRGDRAVARTLFSTVLASRPEFQRARMQLAIVERDDGELERAAALFTELLDAAERGRDSVLRGDALVGLGVIAWRRGELERAEAHYRSAAAAYRAADVGGSLAAVEANLGILAANHGRFEDAEATMQAALARYRERGDRYNTARLLKNLGLLATDRGNPELAQGYLRESVEIRRELELPLDVAMTLSALSDLAANAGRHDQVVALQTEVLAAAETAGDRSLQSLALSDRAAARLQLGAVAAAGEDASRALAVARTLDQPSLLARAHAQAADVYQAQGLANRAREALQQALALYSASGFAPNQLGLHLDLAELELAAGARDAFAAQLAAADALLDEATPAQRARRQWLATRAARDAAPATETAAGYTAAQSAMQDAGRMVSAQRIAAEHLQWLLARGAIAAATKLAEDIERSGVRSVDGLAALAAFHAARGDQAAALHWLKAQREMAGERWSSADAARLGALEQATDARR